MHGKLVMLYQKTSYPSILVLVCIFVLCANGAIAQTTDEKTQARSAAITELATKLLAAKSESDQKALLEAQSELVTVELNQALRKLSDASVQRRDLAQAEVAFRLIRSIAERIGDQEGLAFAIVSLGVLH